jgi:hypothetical protein
MNSGTTVHGSESYAPAYQNLPIAYYSSSSAVGEILNSFFLERSRKIGVVGLGVGALAHYARAQDELTFIEINPVVVEFAEHWFSFLKSSKSKPTIIPGDARIVLSKLAPQKLDILVVRQSADLSCIKQVSVLSSNLSSRGKDFWSKWNSSNNNRS